MGVERRRPLAVLLPAHLLIQVRPVAVASRRLRRRALLADEPALGVPRHCAEPVAEPAALRPVLARAHGPGHPGQHLLRDVGRVGVLGAAPPAVGVHQRRVRLHERLPGRAFRELYPVTGRTGG